MSEHAGRPTDESSGGHDAAERVRASFARQGLMRLLGAEVVEVGEGTCVIEVPFAEGITQQESYFHGAVTAAIADTAGGYAAMPLRRPPSSTVLVPSASAPSPSPSGCLGSGSDGWRRQQR
jgi:hypothetical protein